MTTLEAMVAQARAGVSQTPVHAARRMLEAGDVGAVIDVREPEEWARGHLPGAANIPRGLLELRADEMSPIHDPLLDSSRSRPVLVYCTQAPGVRSLLAAETLQRMGSAEATVLSGGLAEWIAAGLPVESANDGHTDSTPVPMK